MDQKAWIDVKSPRFSNLQPIQYIGIMESCTPPALSPTYMQNIRPLKIADTVYHQSINRDCCDKSHQSTAQKHWETQIISQPGG